MAAGKIRLNYAESDWDKLEIAVKKKGFKSVRSYLVKAIHNATRKSAMEEIIGCDCKKQAKNISFEEGLIEKLQFLADQKCTHVSSIVGRYFLDPLLTEEFRSNNII
jgi:hypothetical protein